MDVSQQFWDTADTVVLARSDAFPDALAAGPLAGYVDAPILLTPPASLDAPVRAEIQRLGAQRVYLVGGTTAMSSAVERAVSAVADPARLSGSNRYETAEAVNDEIAEFRDTGLAFSHGAIVSGMAFPDALAAINIPGFQGDGLDVGPDYISLTPPDSLPGDDRRCDPSYP